MFANKAQERFILNSKKNAEKKKEEKKKTTKTVATTKPIIPVKGLTAKQVQPTPIKPIVKPTPIKSVNIVDQKAKASNAAIAVQKVNYANARSQVDALGQRVANALANKQRASQGATAYSSAVGDKQFAANQTARLAAKKPVPLPNLYNARMNNYTNTGVSASQPVNNHTVLKNIANNMLLFAPTPVTRDVFNIGTALGYGKLPDGLEGIRDRVAQTAYGKAMYGTAQGLSPIDTKPYLDKALLGSQRVEESAPFKVGEAVGTMAGFALPYAGTEKVVGQGLLKAIPRLSNAPKLGQTVAKSVATDLAVGLPLNVNYAVNKEGLSGKEAIKDIAKNTALDIGVGGAMEGLGAIIGKTLRSGKKINTANGLKGLTPDETVEINNIARSGGTVKAKAPRTMQLKNKETYINEIVDELAARHNPMNLTTAKLRLRDDALDKELGKVANMSESEFRQYARENKITSGQTPQLHEQGATSQVVQPQSQTVQRTMPNAEISGLEKDLGADINNTVRSLQDDIDRSGELAEGIPKNTPYGDVSRHAKTIKEGGQFGEGTIKSMLKDIEDGGFGKFTKTNTVAVQNASKKMQNVDDAYVKFKGVLADNKQPTSEDVALGYQLAKHYDEAGEFQKASEILEDTTFMLSETGRTLQAARLAMKNSPLGRQRIATKIAKKISDKTGQNVKLSDEILGKLYGATTEKEISEAFTEAKRELWNQVPPTFIDKFNAWRYTAMLGNLRTVIRNETGNAVSYMMKQFKDILGTGIERAALKRGDRTKAVLTLKDRNLVKAGKEYAKEYMDDLQGAGKYADINEGARPQELPLFGQKNNPFSKTVGKGVEKWRTTTNRALNEGLAFRGFKVIQGDEGWLTKVYGDSFAKVIKANGWTLEQVKKSPELFNQVHELAKLEAQRATFRDASDFATAINKVSGRLRNSDNGLKKIAGYGIEGAMPFKRTPVNILKRSLEYSPVGLVEAAYKFKRAIKNGASMADAIDRLCAGTVGTGTALIGAYLASQGLLTVTIPNDKEGDFEKLQGEQAYALNVNVGGKDVSLTLDWLVPSAVPLFLGAETYNALSDKGATASDIANSLSDIADPVFEMSMLQGLSNLVDTNSYGDGNVASTMGEMAGNLGFSLVGQTVPTLLGQFARTIDPIDRRSNSSDQEGKLEKYVEYNLNKNVLSKIPVLNQKRQEYVDQWGRSEKKKTGKDYARSALENFISPSYVSDRVTTGVDKEISQLYGQNKAKEVLPSVYNKYNVTFKGEDYRMNSSQIEEYKRTKGQYSYSELYKLFQSETYKNMTTEQKEKAVKGVYDESTKKAKSDFLKSQGVDESEVWLGDAGKKALSGYENIKNDISAEDYYKEYYKAQKNQSTAVGKAMSIMSNGNKETNTAVLNGMDISRKSTVKAQRLLDAGITASEYSKIRKEANTDGEDLTTRELLEYIRKNGYSDIQRRAILSANRS